MADDLEANLRRANTVYAKGWHKNVLVPAEFI